ncbi:unnamed protein product [Gongylonema pulchrum]|uniref:EF-hand domain-containing protein n=1 Tax=Gongylonema pulchrum TaxID=637853 RepID=A0A183EY17_9BILA|nr:unnamed protein product [Gongylonema pulchrum]
MRRMVAVTPNGTQQSGARLIQCTYVKLDRISSAATNDNTRLHAAQSHIDDTDDSDFDFHVTRAEFRRSVKKMGPTAEGGNDDTTYDFDHFMEVTSSKAY